MLCEFEIILRVYGRNVRHYDTGSFGKLYVYVGCSSFTVLFIAGFTS